ncbi:MAG TPA: DNA polymerase I [Polyangia bacterium]|nr:DNA polymerase I [Polyangia bacterium]
MSDDTSDEAPDDNPEAARLAAASASAGKPSLFIVDALNFLFRAFHALPPLTTTKGLQTGAIYGLSQMILRIEREERPTHLCVVYDAPGDNFRNEIFPEYKAHRPPMPPELAAQLSLVRQVVDAFGLAQLEVAGFEADDIIASLAKVAKAAGMQVVICSSDKDLMQLCDGDVSVLDTMKNRRLGVEEVREKFGVPPELVGDVLALMGDSVDNVPGVAGIGPKTAAELINKFGSLDALLAGAGEIKGKRGASIIEARESIRLSRELVRLREDVPLPKTLAELHRVDPDQQRLGGLFRELEFSRLAEQLVAFDRENAAKVPGAAPAPVAPAPVPQPPVAVDTILGGAALAELARQIEAAGAVGISALYDGVSAVRGDLVGLGFALPSGRRLYLPFHHRYLGAPVCLPEAALAELGAVLASQAIAKHVHDVKTLEVLLGQRGLALGGVASDPMLAAYLLDAARTHYDLDVVATSEGIAPPAARGSWMGTGAAARPGSDISVEEVGPRLGAEAAASLALDDRQAPQIVSGGFASLYRDMELPLADLLAKVECRGITLDVGKLREIGHEVGISLVALETEIHAIAGGPFNIASNKQLADVLFGKLSLPVGRRTKTGPSTDADTLEELAALHPVPAKIVEFRALAKLRGTYIDALPALVNPATGRLHTSFNQAVAATGRLSSSNPNLQNIPIRTEIGRRIREAFVAKPGHLLVSADYSQIELRILAHFSQDPAFLEAFRSGQDIHLRTAAEVFGVPLEGVTGEQRRIAKAINFGLVFGQSDFGLAQVLRIPRAQARAYIDSYFARYAGVRAYMERAIADARAAGAVSTLLGRRRPLPEIHATRAQDRAYAERIARNTPIQGSAADLLKLAMIRVERGIETGAAPTTDAALLLTVHDELVFEVPEAGVPEFKRWIKNEMEMVYSLAVPLVVDVGAGATWGAAH